MNKVKLRQLRLYIKMKIHHTCKNCKCEKLKIFKCGEDALNNLQCLKILSCSIEICFFSCNILSTKHVTDDGEELVQSSLLIT